MKRACAILVLLLLGCEWPRRAGLLASVDEAPRGPDCASCHPYPPPDANHVLHMGHALADFGNGSISCRDCHTASIQGARAMVLDSIFVSTDSLGQRSEWSGLALPDFRFIRDWPLARVDTLYQVRPIEQEGPTPTAGFLRQWLTGASHLNGAVDVDFDSLVSDTADFGGRRAEYHPESQTCSAVRCHGGSGDYQWPAPSKGLPGRGRYGN
jgi:hypothetical protein